MEMLMGLEPEQQEAVLEALANSGEFTVEDALEFPDLLDLGDALNEEGEDGTEGEEQPEQLFLDNGDPLLDSEGEPVYFTEELRRLLETQSPEDWLLSETPFFQQDLKLEPFGYELFSGVPTTFAPATDIPVPPEYRLGPGDTIEVQLFGKQNRQYSLVITRDGTVNFPGIGPINVMGQSYQELKQELLDAVAEQLIGTSAAISMGPLRSIQVLILGDAKRPGSYTISGLSTITNALFVSGGVSKIGSMRKIQLKRSGRRIVTLDLYDLLIRGDTDEDVRLESGDVIFIPPIGTTVGVGGFVKRPAIYELLGEATVEDVIELAGGLRPDAFPGKARIERIDPAKQRSYINIDASDPMGRETRLQSGDTLLIPPVLKEYVAGVELIGEVEVPGRYEWKPGLRLTDVITGFDMLKPQADVNYVLIRRESQPDKRILAISADLEKALKDPSSEENLLLQPRDQIWVWDLTEERIEPIASILEELNRQSSPDSFFQKVTIRGQVRAPGDFPYEQGMTVGDLIRAGAGMLDGAYPYQAELTRRLVIDNNMQSSTVINVDPGPALAGDPASDIPLKPLDLLVIRPKQRWQEQQSINLMGEVKFPGRYTFNPGDDLASILQRAGGLTERAFPAGSVFLREELKQREQDQINQLRDRLQSDLAQLALQAAGSVERASVGDAQSAGSALLASLTAAEATGRLVIDLPSVVANPDDPANRILLRDGDSLFVPERTQSVTVIGEVFFPTSHLYERGQDRNSYIQLSGGITPNGSKKNIYLVRANGAVLAGRSKWFRGNRKVQPGDTIVVPLDTEKGFRLRAWSSITTIVYNAAIAAAAINGLSN